MKYITNIVKIIKGSNIIMEYIKIWILISENFIIRLWATGGPAPPLGIFEDIYFWTPMDKGFQILLVINPISSTLGVIWGHLWRHNSEISDFKKIDLNQPLWP